MAGHLHEAQGRSLEEGVWAKCAVWMRDCAFDLRFKWSTDPVCESEHLRHPHTICHHWSPGRELQQRLHRTGTSRQSSDWQTSDQTVWWEAIERTYWLYYCHNVKDSPRFGISSFLTFFWPPVSIPWLLVGRSFWRKAKSLCPPISKVTCNLQAHQYNILRYALAFFISFILCRHL